MTAFVVLASISSSNLNMSLPRGANKVNDFVELTYLPSNEINAGSTYRLLVITDPERADLVNLSAVRKIFRLSAAEESVAIAMISGSSYREIAEKRCVSTETVRTQLSSVLRKSGCNNRTELVCLAHKTTIPVDR